MNLKIEKNQIYNIDGIELLENIYNQFGENSVEMIILDLPYTTNKNKRVTGNKWDIPFDIEKLFLIASKLLKISGAMILTATNPFSAYLISKSIEMENNPKYKDLKLVKYKYEWIWEKDNGTNFVSVKHQPFRVHEQVLVFGLSPTTYNKKGIYMNYNPQFGKGKVYKAKRKKKLTEFEIENNSNLSGFKGRISSENNDGKRYPRSVLKFNSEKGIHRTQKPVSLFSYLINTHSPKNGLVIDVCCGSGTTAISCIETGRDFIVGELNEDIYLKAKKRILEKNYI